MAQPQHPQRNHALRLLGEGLKPTEVARRLDVKPGTVRMWKSRESRRLAAGDQNAYSNATPPPYGNAPYYGQGGQSRNSPMDTMQGTTPQAPDPGSVRPRVNAPPMGASGRANFYGLPQPDETNVQLMGPQGMRNFDLMYRTDPDIRRLVLMCSTPIIAGTWDLRPFGGEQATDQDVEIAEACWWALAKHMSPDFFEHLNTMLPMLLRFGFVPFEQIWDSTTFRGKNLVVPRKLDVRLPRSIWRWWQDDYGELTHIGQILPNKPDVVIDITDLVYYRLGAEGDNWVGTSLLRHCYKPWVMKDRLERIDAIGQERKAVGVPIVYMPENADDQTRDDVETVLANLHTNEVGYMLMPGPHAQDVKDMPGMQGYRVDVIKFDSSSGDSIQASLTYHTQKIASAFLGDFMQLGHHQVGARATASVQFDPFITAIEALATFIMPPLNDLVARMVKLNWPNAQGAPTFNLTLSDAASLTEISTYVTALVTSDAMQVDPELEDWLRSRGDLPPADPDVRAYNKELQLAKDAAELQAAQQQLPKAGSGESPSSFVNPPSKNAPDQQGTSEKAQGGKAPQTPQQSNKASASAARGKPTRSKSDAARGVSSLDESRAKLRELHAQGVITDDELSILMFRLNDEENPFLLSAGEDEPANPNVRQLAQGEPTAKWWENLLSQDRLRDALDTCRERIETTAKPATLVTARKMAHQAVNGAPLSAIPPDDLVNALATHLDEMHRLGQDTVRQELATHRAALHHLDLPGSKATGRAGSVLQRAHRAARTIVERTKQRLENWLLNHRDQHGDMPQAQAVAEEAATRALREVALDHTAAQINEGRTQAGVDGDAVGAYRTAVLDKSTCPHCASEDTGQLLSMPYVLAHPLPDPDCAGGDRCRCTYVFVAGDDPAAKAAGLG